MVVVGGRVGGEMYRIVELHTKVHVVDPSTGRRSNILRESDTLRIMRGRDGLFIVESLRTEGKTRVVVETWYIEATNVACSRPASTELPVVQPEEDEPPPTTPSGKMPTTKPAPMPAKRRGRAA